MFVRMKSNTPNLVALAAVLLFAAVTADAENEGKANPYESIVERNPFQLKPPPPPAPPDAGPVAPPPPLATVELTGVTSIFSKKKALVEIVPGPGKPPMKLTLDEGERVDAIEIVSIDVEKAEVTINNAGSITNLSLKIAKAGGPAAPTGPTPPQFGGVVPPVPTPINPTATTYASGRNSPIVGGASSPSPTLGFGTQPANTLGAQPGAYGGAPNIYNSGGAVPNTSLDQLRGAYSRTPRTTTTVPQQNAAQPPVDPAVQYINMHIQKQQMEARGVPMPPIPPVPGVDP